MYFRAKYKGKNLIWKYSEIRRAWICYQEVGCNKNYSIPMGIGNTKDEAFIDYISLKKEIK